MARKVGGRGARREGAGKYDTEAVISPTANCTEFRKLSVTLQFRSRLAARLHSVAAAAAPARKQEGGGGGAPEFARGQPGEGHPPPGRRAFQPRVGSGVPCLAMISSFRKSGRPGRACHVPGSAPCAAPGDPPGRGRGRGHRGSQRRAEGKGWRLQRGSGLPDRAGARLRRDRGSQGAVLPRTPAFHPREGRGQGAERGSQLRGWDAGFGPRDGAAVPSREPPPGGARFPACAPPRSARSRQRGGGCPTRA